MIVDDNIILMHEPPKEHYIVPEFFYVFGHVHEKKCIADEYSNCKCVSVERIDYKPLNFKKILFERNAHCE